MAEVLIKDVIDALVIAVDGGVGVDEVVLAEAAVVVA